MMNQKLLFGAAYYPEYMPYDRVKEDLVMMKNAGMNVIRIAESTWSTLEPEPGVFRFDVIDQVLDEIETLHMMAIVGTPTYAIPSWVEKMDSDVMVLTKNGQMPYGHRQQMDIMNETFRTHAKEVICRIVEHTARRKSVIGYQIDNETKHYGTAGPKVQEMFLQHLKDKFKTTDAVNHAFGLTYWSNSIARWEDFPHMDGCINGGLSAEFEMFQRKLAEDYLRWQAEIVRKYAREDQFVTHNLDFAWKKFGADIAQEGYSYGVQPDMEHHKVSKFLDVAGTDIYHLTQDDLTGAEIAFGGDEIRSLKQQEYFVLECQAQGFKYWTPYTGQLRLQAYSHLASGAAALLYWNWHSIHNGYETYWKGVLSHDLASNPTYEEACEIGKEFQRIGRKRLVIAKKNDIAMIVDNHTLTSYKWFPIDKELSYNDVVRWMYDSLYEMNLECDVIHAEDLEIGDYKVIITPALYSVTDELTEQLNDFVRGGGILISTFKSFVADRNLSVHHDTQPHHMTECFGMSYNQYTNPGRAMLKLNHEEYELQYFMELLKYHEAEQIAGYQHPYWGDYAAVTKNRYGQGTAYYIGAFVGKEALKQIYRGAFDEAGMAKALCWPITIRSGVNELGEKVHYVLHYSEKTENIVCPYDAVTDLLTDRSYQKGDVITLSDWSVCILVEGIEK